MGKQYDLFDRMNERYDRMSKSHKAISDYISEYYDQAVFMTAAKLGETLGISESTVVRFATGIGYSGYPEFVKALEECVKAFTYHEITHDKGTIGGIIEETYNHVVATENLKKYVKEY